jgi:RNA polymerase sigma factor (sigma-70 family)
MTLKQTLKDLPESLTPQEETALFARKAPGTQDKVLLHSIAEGVYYARRCCRQMISDAELVSLVYSALSRAIKNYNPVKFPGSRFFAYGKIYIRGEIKREWTRRDVVRNSSSHETMIELDCGDDPESEDSTIKVQQVPGLHPDATITEEMDFKAMETKELLEHIQPALERVLNKREYAVIQRYYFGKGETFVNIGKRWKITRQAVETTHKKALAKIRKYLEVNRIA